MAILKEHRRLSIIYPFTNNSDFAYIRNKVAILITKQIGIYLRSPIIDCIKFDDSFQLGR